MLLLTTIIDQDQRFRHEFIIWAQCANTHSTESHVKKIAYFIDSVPEDLREFAASQNIEIRIAKTFLPGSPHCNKMIPLFDEQNQNSDGIIITDSDLFFVSDPALYFKEDKIRLAPNNGNNPPLSIYQKLFKHFGFEAEPRIGESLMPGPDGSRESYINNNSGGIIMIPKFFLQDLKLHWKKWAVKLINEKEILGRWKIHIDQVAFALAMESIGQDIQFLPAEINATLKYLPNLNNVEAFHITKTHRFKYADWFNNIGELNIPNARPKIKAATDKLNKCIRSTELNRKLYPFPSPPSKSFLSRFFARFKA